MRFFKGNKKSKKILKEELEVLEDRFSHVNELIEYNLEDREYFINKLYSIDPEDNELNNRGMLERLEEEYKELVDEREKIFNDLTELFDILN